MEGELTQPIESRAASKAPNQFVVMCVNSTMAGLVAFIILYTTQLYATAVIGTFFELDSVVWAHKLLFKINHGKWNTRSLVITFAAAPVIMLINGLVARSLIMKNILNIGVLRIFYAWYAFYGIGLFFSLIVQGLFMDRAFGYVFRPFGVNYLILVVIGAVAVIIEMLFHKTYSNFFLRTAISEELRAIENRKKFLFASVLIPFFAVVVLFNLLSFSVTIPNLFIFGNLAAMITATYFYAVRSYHAGKKSNSRINYISSKLFIILGAVVTVYVFLGSTYAVSVYRLLKVHLGL